MQYLIQIHIGPVQDFIATARRTRDLWFGSWLLCELARSAVLEIKNHRGAESLIFPFFTEQYELDAPNKIVARVEAEDFEKIKSFCRDVEEAVKNRLRKIRDEAFNNVRGEFERDIAKQQVEDMLEFYWAAVEFADGNYALARAKLEYVMAARKATRDFRQVARIGSGKENAWSSNVPKSALDGARESVIPEDRYPKSSDDHRTREEKIRDLFSLYGVREHERLCGVGLLKRHGNRSGEDKFFSTSHVAALPLIKSVKRNGKAREAVSVFKNKLNELGLEEAAFHTVPRPDSVFGEMDGHFLFEERMSDFFSDPETIKQAREAVRELLKELFGEDRKPSPYYALLHADGDNMGKVIDALKEPDQHRKFSRTLSEFARKVKGIVNEEYEGSLIYSGGDDVLALLPLHTVLHCAKKLSDEFKSTLKGFKAEGGVAPTLSIGIAVVHHLEPLQDALELARRAEREAKSVRGKDAMAIIVDRRSGASRMIADKTAALYERLQELIAFDEGGEISRQTAYALRELALQIETVREQGAWQEMKRAEARRILKRKLSGAGQKDFDEEKYKRLLEIVERENGIKQLADELVIAKIFGDAKRQSEGKL
jgi:CRISPR-associated protein Cmr2